MKDGVEYISGRDSVSIVELFEERGLIYVCFYHTIAHLTMFDFLCVNPLACPRFAKFVSCESASL